MPIQVETRTINVPAGQSVVENFSIASQVVQVTKLVVTPVQSGGNWSGQLIQFSDGWPNPSGLQQIALERSPNPEALIAPHLVQSGQILERGDGFVAVYTDYEGTGLLRLKLENFDASARDFDVTVHWINMVGLDGNGNLQTPGLQISNSGSLEIAAGAITIGRGGLYEVLNEAAASDDDLDTINGGQEGMMLFLRASFGASTTNIKHDIGNIFTLDAGDILLDNRRRTVMFIYNGDRAKWLVMSVSN